MTRSLLRYKAFAKVNLFLEVRGKRRDGYHDIHSLLVNVDLADVLVFKKTRSGIALSCDSNDVPSGSENLCVKAVQALKEYTGHGDGVTITLRKKIPVASGLGGGSSDAACTLIGVSKLWGLALAQRELVRLAEKIGSDVPFFIRGGAQLVGGRGERLTAVKGFPKTWFVLVTPSLKISSGWAYSLVKLGLTRGGHKFKIISPGAGFDAASVGKILRNDLEKGVIKTHPVVRELKDALISHGAIGSLMSGSGPTVFGVARGRTSATAIASEMIRTGLFVCAASTVRKGWAELSQK